MAPQINVRLPAAEDAEFNQLADRLGIDRGPLARKIIIDALTAMREGRASFERPETLSPADLQLLVGRIDTALLELDRILRHHLDRDAALAKSARDDTVRISEARTAIVSQVAGVIDRQSQPILGAIAALSQKTDNLPAITVLFDALKTLQAEIVKRWESDLSIAAERHAEIIREIRKQRAFISITLADKNYGLTFFTVWTLVAAAIGSVVLLRTASLFPPLTVPVASWLLPGDPEICQVVDRHYGVTNCTTSQMKEKSEENELIRSMAPPPHVRRKHR